MKHRILLERNDSFIFPDLYIRHYKALLLNSGRWRLERGIRKSSIVEALAQRLFTKILQIEELIKSPLLLPFPSAVALAFQSSQFPPYAQFSGAHSWPG